MLSRFLKKAVDNRFGQLPRQVAEARAHLTQRLDEVVTLERDLGGHLGILEKRIEDMQRSAHTAEDLVTVTNEGIRSLRRSMAGFEASYQIPPPEQRNASQLAWPVAEYLNWAEGPYGYAAQGGLFFNHPVLTAHEAAGVRVTSVNERIVEIPFVLQALSELPDKAKVIDVGGAESTLALSLCSLGHSTTVVDPRGYALEHPLLEKFKGRLDEFHSDAVGFDAAVALSAVEHFGLAAYEGDVEEPDADRAAIEDLRSRVVPGGMLVLTVPLGRPRIDALQRYYDGDGVRALLDGWDIERLDAAWQSDATTWETGPIDEPTSDRGVALAVARATA